VVYTQADTGQPAYTGTETDLIIVVAGKSRFTQLESSGEQTFSATDRFPLFPVSVYDRFQGMKSGWA